MAEEMTQEQKSQWKAYKKAADLFVKPPEIKVVFAEKYGKVTATAYGANVKIESNDPAYKGDSIVLIDGMCTILPGDF